MMTIYLLPVGGTFFIYFFRPDIRNSGIVMAQISKAKSFHIRLTQTEQNESAPNRECAHGADLALDIFLAGLRDHNHKSQP
jgi:hypothetical protein